MKYFDYPYFKLMVLYILLSVLYKKSRNQRVVKMVVIRFLLSFLIFVYFPAHAIEKESYGNFYEPMKFVRTGNGGNCNGCEWISAIGMIDEFTPAKFEQFFRENPYSLTVVFHSPGGSLIAGMELGRLLRKYNIPVSIGETQRDSYNYSKKVDGICASACAYAFLGGVSRSIDADSKIGFHQFYTASALDESIRILRMGNSLLSVDQVLSGLLAEYLSDMGIDARILRLASLAGSNQLLTPNDHELKLFRIVTSNDFSPIQLEHFRNGIRVFSTNGYVGYPVRKLSAFCRRKNKKAVFMIETDKVSLTKESIFNIEFSSDDGNTNILIPTNNINIFNGETTDGIIIYLSEDIKARALNSRSFNFSIDSPRVTFGTFIEGGFNLNNDERNMLRLAWSNCI